MVIKTVLLETVCGVTSTIPAGRLPEFAFAGRSNVGKSTLINGLMNRKSYARTSAQPGKTQTINYYNINDAFHLVDLPGYGYTKANVNVRRQWGKMIERYLHTSQMLQAVFLLVDIRHEPTADDIRMFDWMLEAGWAPVVIATKADKIKRSQLQKQTAMITRTLKEKSERGRDVTLRVIPYSGVSQAGRDEIYALLDSFLEGPETEAQEPETAGTEITEV